MKSIDTAVILAAGTGSRMTGTNGDKPKGFIELDGMTLIERSAAHLYRAGIRNLVIGTGYQKAYYEAFKSSLEINCIFNPLFAETGSMYTLWNLRNALNSAFLLLESDLLYDPVGLQLLLNDPHEDVILASGMTHSGDEVFIETTSDSHLINMSKNPALLNKTDAELVGISKVSFSAFQLMCKLAEPIFRENMRLDYESVMVKAVKDMPFYVLVSESLIWCEIDDPIHYQRALRQIYPKLRRDFW